MQMRMWVLPVAMAVSGPFAATQAAAEPTIGSVALEETRSTTGTRVSGEARDLAYQEPVYADERVDTAALGQTNLVFLDDTNLYVGEKSSVVLDRFVYDTTSRNGDVAISFTKGAFRFVTGQIKSKDKVTLRTPTASIAIRGTRILLFVLPDGTSEINLEEGSADVFVCSAPDPVRVETGRQLLITSSCDRTSGPARDTADIGYPVPQYPTEYAQLLDIEPAAGEDTTEQTASNPPDWVRGRRSDHEPNERGGRD